MDKLKPKANFTKNVITLMTGTTVAQAIPIAVSPVLTRLYSPKDFGLFALYLSTTSILSVISTGRYEMAIMLPKKNEDALNVLALSILLSFFVSFIILILFFLFNKEISEILAEPDISCLLYFIPLNVFLISIFQCFNNWLNRNSIYKIIAIGRAAKSVVTAIVNLCLGFNNFGKSGLVFGQILGQGAVGGILGIFIWRKNKYYSYTITKRNISAMGKKYIKFPLITLWSSFINSFYNNGKFIILSAIFIPATLGQIYLTFRVIMIPVSIISINISDVLYQKISAMKNINMSNKDILIKLKKTMCLLMIIAILPSSVIYFFGEYLFSFIFGKNWLIAGKYASILSLSLFFQFSISPFCKIFYVFEKNGLYLFWEFSRIIMVFVPLLILNHFDFNITDMIWCMSLCISLSYIVLIILLYKVLNVE